MKILNKSFLLAMMLPLTGCGTLMTLDQPEVYSGVQEDVSRLTFSKTAPEEMLVRPLVQFFFIHLSLLMFH